MRLIDWFALIIVGIPLGLCLWTLAITSLAVCWRLMIIDLWEDRHG